MLTFFYLVASKVPFCFLVSRSRCVALLFCSSVSTVFQKKSMKCTCCFFWSGRCFSVSYRLWNKRPPHSKRQIWNEKDCHRNARQILTLEGEDIRSTIVNHRGGKCSGVFVCGAYVSRGDFLGGQVSCLLFSSLVHMFSDSFQTYRLEIYQTDLRQILGSL